MTWQRLSPLLYSEIDRNKLEFNLLLFLVSEKYLQWNYAISNTPILTILVYVVYSIYYNLTYFFTGR